MTNPHDETDVFLGGCRLDHDGCVVCADAGIPVRVLAITGNDALCEDAGGNQAAIAIDLVLPVRIGEVLVTHGGVAIGRVEESSGRVKSLYGRRRRRPSPGVPHSPFVSTPRLLDRSTTARR